MGCWHVVSMYYSYLREPTDLKLTLLDRLAWLKDTNVGPAIWRDWVPGALATGTLQCKPDLHVVGRRLEKMQEAVDTMETKPSAKKFVVEFPYDGSSQSSHM